MKRSTQLLPVLFLLVACSSHPQDIAIAPSPSATPSSIPTPTTSSPIPVPSIENPSPTSESNSSPNNRTGTLTAQDPDAQINVREDASTRSVAQHYGVVGDVVQILNEKTGDDSKIWYQVKFQSGATGWVNGQFVAAAGNRSTVPSSPLVSPSPQSQELTPIRESISGSCECPYDTDKRGRSCGRRSAYSRPGGASPICYK